MQSSTSTFSEKLFATFEHIKISKWPLFLHYHPHSFAIKGSQTQEVIKLIQPGDILVRSFNNYLNTHFLPGVFTHAGFYLGEVNDMYLKQFGNVVNNGEFNTGSQMVIHAIGNHVWLEDLIDFCRCDGLAVMRFPRQLKSLSHREIPKVLQDYFNDPTQAAKMEPSTDANQEEDAKSKAKKAEKTPVEVKEPVKLDATALEIIKAEKEIAQRLAQGKAFEFNKIFKFLYRNALMQLSTPYDYDFGMEPFHATRCTELIYFITKSIGWNYGIEPQPARILFKQRNVILPDAFVDNDLEEIWKVVS
jgi:hypothetical protein